MSTISSVGGGGAVSIIQCIYCREHRDHSDEEERIVRQLGHAAVETTELYGHGSREIVHDVLADGLPS